MEEKVLSLELETEIKKVAEKIKKEKKISRVFPIVVFGDTSVGEKEHYVAYFGEPSFQNFAKYIKASRADDVIAQRTLAKDCFLEGDKELVDNDSMFLFGTMNELSSILSVRRTTLVNL